MEHFCFLEVLQCKGSRVNFVRFKGCHGHGSVHATNALHPEPTVEICLESNDIVLELEGDAEVAPEVDGVPVGTFRWRAREALPPRHCLHPRRLILTANLVSF